MRAMDEKDPKRTQEFTKLVDLWRPELDVLALSSYPADPFGGDPAKMPGDYYDHIFDHAKRSDEIMFMELGWQTTGKGSESSQLAFIRRLPDLLGRVHPSIVAWALLHDVRAKAIGGAATTGLLDPSGKPKPALQAFKEIGRR
jgi:hypothetical protein